MKREEFLKTAAIFAGGFTFAGCSKDLITELTGEGKLDSLSIAEAEKWFSEVYLNKYTGLRTEDGGQKKYKRKANWGKANNKKDERKQDFIWVPVEYEDDQIPGVILMDENSTYKQALGKYLVQPIIEGMVVTKKKNTTEAALIQIAFDPTSVRKNGNKLNLSKFTGTLLRADWDDNATDVILFKDGQKTEAYAAEGSNNTRVSGCFEIEVVYQTVGVLYHMDGTYEWTVTLHKVRRMSCTPMGTSPGSGSVGGGVSVNGGAYYGGSSSSNGVDIPNTHQAYLRPNYIVKDALGRNGSQRALLNQRVNDFLEATAVGVSALDWTLVKAEALAKVLGAELKTFFPYAEVFGKRVGGLSLILDGIEVYGVWDEAGRNWNNLTTWNQVKIIVFGTGAIAFVAGAFWLAAAAGTVSFGMAVVEL